MDHLHLKNIGQIVNADLSFGDLTVLVGPQATGKSIALQLLRLMIDPGYIEDRLWTYGLDWFRDLKTFFNLYLGEGMGAIWNDNSSIEWNKNAVDIGKVIGRRQQKKEEKAFFIPAQRVLTLREGWPRPFTDYSSSDPFAVREFSDKLRLLMDDFLRSGDELFPQARRLKSEYRSLLQQSLFGKFHLKVDKTSSQRRLILGNGQSNSSLPFMVWSAGQREFVPLLLGFYRLMPSTKVSTRDSIQWVLLEELEMGLHPRAITTVLLLVFELVERGYRVCLSTHSAQVLDALWAIRYLRDSNAEPDALLRIFGVERTPQMRRLATTMMQKELKVHYFDQGGNTSDISNLDATSNSIDEAEWGGLSEFSGRANDEVARAVSKFEQSK